MIESIQELEVDVLALQTLSSPTELVHSDLPALGHGCLITCEKFTLCNDTVCEQHSICLVGTSK